MCLRLSGPRALTTRARLQPSQFMGDSAGAE